LKKRTYRCAKPPRGMAPPRRSVGLIGLQGLSLKEGWRKGQSPSGELFDEFKGHGVLSVDQEGARDLAHPFLLLKFVKFRRVESEIVHLDGQALIVFEE